MKKEKFECVEYVLEWNGLIDIKCHYHYDGVKCHHEHYFLDKNTLEIKAHFTSTGCLDAENLSSENESIFYVSESFFKEDKEEDKELIVKVNPDLSYEILHEIGWIEFGIEDGAFAIMKEGLYGFIDYNGIEFIKPQYDKYCAFRNGFACVQKDEKWGFINKKNELIIPYEYENTEDSKFMFEEHIKDGKFILLSAVIKNGRYGFIDALNNIIIPFEYEDTAFKDNEKPSKFIPVKKDGKWGVIDTDNNIAMPFIYDEIEANGDSLPYYYVSKDNLKGLADYNANLIIPCIYKDLCVNKKRIKAQKQNEKYVLLDYTGREVSKEYDFIEDYSECGLYCAENNNKYGYISDETGEIVIPFKYRSGESFKGGLCVTERHSSEGAEVINTKGEVLYHAAHRYADVFNMGNGCILAENKDGEYEIKRLI